MFSSQEKKERLMFVTISFLNVTSFLECSKVTFSCLKMESSLDIQITQIYFFFK